MIALNRLQSQPQSSTVSLISESSFPSIGGETNSGSSSSTVPGPGALTGKALKALGKVTLRGFDRIVMNRHLTTVIHSFPHTDAEASNIQNIQEIYDDLLEFSRPGMYSADTGERAIGIILRQIGMGHTRQLVRAIARWHLAELHLLLSEILIQLSSLWNPSLQLVLSSPLFSSYAVAQSSPPSLIHLILFLSKLIRTSSWICRVVLQVGFLDVLFSICQIYDFPSVKVLESGHGAHPANIKHLLIAANTALLDIMGYPEYRPLILNHPIHNVWPEHRFISATDSVATTPILLDADKDVTFDDYSSYFTLSIADMCGAPYVTKIHPDHLLLSLATEVTHRQALRVYLARSSQADKITLLSGIVQAMSRTMSETTDLIDSDFPLRHQRLFSLRLLVEIAQDNRQALLDAGVAAYLMDVLRKEIPDSYLAIITSRSDTWSIANTIKECGLSGLLDGRGSPDARMRHAIYAVFAALFKDRAAGSRTWALTLFSFS